MKNNSRKCHWEREANEGGKTICNEEIKAFKKQ